MAHEAFEYKSGCKLNILDFGDDGLKVTMEDPDARVVSAVLLPIEKVKEFEKWIANTIGMAGFQIPPKLHNLLTRMSKTKRTFNLRRGDQGLIKEAIKVLIKLEKNERAIKEGGKE